MVSMHTSPAASAGTGDAGGMNVLVLAIAQELATRGVDVDLLTRAEAEPRTVELGDGITLHELAAGPPRPLPKADLVAATDEFGEAVANLAGRTGAGYDVIHAHYWLSGLATLPVAIELGIPLVQSFHTLAAMKDRMRGHGERPEPELRRKSEMFLANQASAIIAGSSAEVTALIDDVRAPAEKIWVIPPGVDIDLFRPGRSIAAGDRARLRLGITAGRPIISVVGRVQPLKDQELAIRTLAELHAQRGWAPVLVIAGDATPGDDDYLASLQRVAATLGVSGDIRFVGGLDREALADLLAASSVTLVPSRSETFGLVALESAASGTPVVGFRGTGLLESVADGRSGLLLDSREPRAWATAVSGLLEDAPELGRLSATARRHAEGYTWAATATALLGVYAGLGAALAR